MELYEVVGWAFLALIMGFIALVCISTWRQMLREARDAGLLPERRERQIAEVMRQSPKTTHKHVTTILQKYGVNSRVALMALWLNRM